MNENNIINIDIKKKPTNYIVYRNLKFPIFLRIFSSFAQIDQKNIQPNSNIPLLNQKEDKEINLNNISIINFILYCHNRDYEINNENAVFIDFLAKKIFC